ncbi:hypothetical protein [Pseudoalteromonas sp. MQS005]|uniref:hypothetical protein n=1 Tax=Pseudoalteromonas sp. MQS005 TaxID=1854052 RepID=UPI0007E5058D|nr:hypothetical protein [Pseudoalteromonas sp. MQS005]
MEQVIDWWVSLLSHTNADSFYLKQILTFSGLLILCVLITIVKYTLKKCALSHLLVVCVIAISYLTTDYVLAKEAYEGNLEPSLDFHLMYFMFSVFDSLTAIVILVSYPLVSKSSNYSSSVIVVLGVLLINSVMHLFISGMMLYGGWPDKYDAFFYSSIVFLNSYILMTSLYAPSLIEWLSRRLLYMKRRLFSGLTRA